MVTQDSLIRTPTSAFRLHPLLRALRIHQWVKNLLIFIPVFAAHRWTELGMVAESARAFLAFGLCASGIYLLNDIIDLESDRNHAIKRSRALATGEVSVEAALVAAMVLISASAITCLGAPIQLGVTLGSYLTLALAYSFLAKPVAMLDTILLAIFYTLRVIAGHAATHIPYSPWLLAFCLFFFLSLAFVKRSSELIELRKCRERKTRGRDYRVADLALLTQLGITSGYLSVLVLALYINSPEGTPLYDQPLLLWLLCPVMLYWISRLWLLCRRGQIHQDPILFALNDRVTWILGVATFAVILIASHG